LPITFVCCNDRGLHFHMDDIRDRNVNMCRRERPVDRQNRFSVFEHSQRNKILRKITPKFIRTLYNPSRSSRPKPAFRFLSNYLSIYLIIQLINNWKNDW